MNVFEYFYSSTNIKQDEGGGSSKLQIIFLAQVFYYPIKEIRERVASNLYDNIMPSDCLAYIFPPNNN